MSARVPFIRALVLCTGLAVTLLVSAQTAPVEPETPAPSAQRLLPVEIGTQSVLRPGAPVFRVAVGDSEIADVTVVSQNELLVSGKKLGITSLLVWLERNGPPREYRIRVIPVVDPVRPPQPDPEHARAQVEPGKSLSGRLPNLMAHRRARLEAQPQAQQAADNSAVELETQVMTEVRIAEISRNTLQQFGFNFYKNVGNTLASVSGPGSTPSISFPNFPYQQPNTLLAPGQNGGPPTAVANPQAGESTGTFGLGGSLVPLQNAFALVYGSPVDGLLGVLSVLQQKGMARVLAEPTLLATSGQTATYLAGGEFPVPVSQGGITGGGITIQYKEFGVRLTLSPTVLARDRISLKVAPEVSDLDFSTGIQIAGVAVPSLTVRRTDTTIELGDGESFVISGLVSSNLINNVSKVPWLGDIPVIGSFFKSTALRRQEKELVMVVTPRLVRPLARGARVPSLPGAEYDAYDPDFGDVLLENGDFNTGFSRR